MLSMNPLSVKVFGDVIKSETKNKKYSSRRLQQDTNSLYKQGPKPLLSRKGRAWKGNRKSFSACPSSLC